MYDMIIIGAGHFPTCSLHCFSIIYRLFKRGYMGHYMEIPELCQERKP